MRLDSGHFLDLVVARYGENCRWLRRVPAAFRVWVYDKSPAAEQWPGAIPLPNRGLEAHTYLHHLVENYDRLASVTVFLQGYPFDHEPLMHQRLAAIASGEIQVRDFYWFGFIVDTEDRQGSLFSRWSKNRDRRGLNMVGFCRALWGEDGPQRFHFHCSAQFAVTRELVHRQGREFYERARQLALDFPDAAHCFERTWDRVFGVRGVDPATLDADGMRYERPVRQRKCLGSSRIGS